MKRYGQVIKLKKERIKAYVELHSAVWSDVSEAIKESCIRNYSIFLKDETLFAYFEYVGSDYDRDMKQLANNAAVQKWWNMCKPCMLPLESRKEGEWWANMEEIFYQD